MADPSSTDPPGPVPARPGATIMLVRDDPGARSAVLEVCMLRRHTDSYFGGVYVFPGGKVDDDDRSTAAEQACDGRTDAEASAMLGLSTGGLAFWVAALRECFEEAGVLLARRRDGGLQGGLLDATDPVQCRHLAERRAALNAGEIGFFELLRLEGLWLAVDRVHYFSHWITPEAAPKRFDTRFFVAALPAGQVPVHDEHEMVDTVWVKPGDALRRAAAGEFELIFPTMKNLEAVERFATSDELLEAAAAAGRVPTVLPRVVTDKRGFRILLPGDEGYEEAIGAVDGSAGRSMTSAEVGEAIRSVDAEGRSRRR